MASISRGSISAAAGEYLVLGELLKRKFEAYLAHGETQKGWDIALIVSGAVIRIQVKTIDWPSQRAVNGNLTAGFDVLVVVLLDREKSRSRFFIFDVTSLDKNLSPVNDARGTKRTLTMSNISIINAFADNEDKWSLFAQVEIDAAGAPEGRGGPAVDH